MAEHVLIVPVRFGPRNWRDRFRRRLTLTVRLDLPDDTIVYVTEVALARPTR
jgi:hypothetical protein